MPLQQAAAVRQVAEIFSAFNNPCDLTPDRRAADVLCPLLADTVSVTNHAGRAVTGEFGGVTNGTFIVSGRAYPLSILPKDEQQRVKELAGLDARTAKEKRLDHARDMRLERIRLREAEGEIDKATAERLRREDSD